MLEPTWKTQTPTVSVFCISWKVASCELQGHECRISQAEVNITSTISNLWSRNQLETYLGNWRYHHGETW